MVLVTLDGLVRWVFDANSRLAKVSSPLDQSIITLRLQDVFV